MSRSNPVDRLEKKYSKLFNAEDKQLHCHNFSKVRNTTSLLKDKTSALCSKKQVEAELNHLKQKITKKVEHSSWAAPTVIVP